MTDVSGTDLVCVGTISGSYGVKGEVRFKSFTAQPEDIVLYNPLTDENGARQFIVGITRGVKNGFSGRIEGIQTKEQADDLRGTKLYARRDQLPSLPNDEFYHADLIDLEVLDTGGAVLGRVKQVMNHGAGDLLEIHGPGMSATVLIPFTREAVPTVDLTAGRIIVDPPEGSL